MMEIPVLFKKEGGCVNNVPQGEKGIGIGRVEAVSLTGGREEKEV